MIGQRIRPDRSMVPQVTLEGSTTLTITDRALESLRSLLCNNPVLPNRVVKFTQDDQGHLGIMLVAEANDDDLILAADVVVDRRLAERLAGHVIDYGPGSLHGQSSRPHFFIQRAEAQVLPRLGGIASSLAG